MNNELNDVHFKTVITNRVIKIASGLQIISTAILSFVMFSLCLFKVFVLFYVLKTVGSDFSYQTRKATYGCDNHYANLYMLPPLKPENDAGILRLVTFKKLPSIHLRIIGTNPRNETLLDQSVNLCFLENRRTNIFVKLFFDYVFGSIPGFKRYKCPFEVGVYEIPERSTKSFANTASKYLPSFIRIQGVLKVIFEISTRERGESIVMCKINETWTFKFD